MTAADVTMSTVFLPHILSVGSGITLEKVGRIYTAAVIAGMKAHWHRPTAMSKVKGDTMNEHLPILPTDMSIALLGQASGPVPAGIGLFNTVPEVGLSKSSHRSILARNARVYWVI